MCIKSQLHLLRTSGYPAPECLMQDESLCSLAQNRISQRTSPFDPGTGSISSSLLSLVILARAESNLLTALWQSMPKSCSEKSKEKKGHKDSFTFYISFYHAKCRI